MKLFLASEAKHPDSMEKLKNFVGGFDKKTVAYIPTAANGENPYGEWEQTSSTWQPVKESFQFVTPVVLEDFKNKNALDLLVDKDIIWFAGGSVGYLMYWLKRCEIDKNIRQLLSLGNIYVGSSAGSMVASPTLDIAEMLIGDEEAGTTGVLGLGLVDFDIYPHFEDTNLNRIKELYNGKKLYLLKNGEAITVVGDDIKILGETRVIES